MGIVEGWWEGLCSLVLLSCSTLWLLFVFLLYAFKQPLGAHSLVINISFVFTHQIKLSINTITISDPKIMIKK